MYHKNLQYIYLLVRVACDVEKALQDAVQSWCHSGMSF